MQSEKSKTREYFRKVQGPSFDERAFNRLWKTTTQHIRRITGDAVNTSVEARYHLTRQGGESVLDYAYSLGGVRGRKQEIKETFTRRLTLERTHNFINANGGKVVDGKRLSTWRNMFINGAITKEEYYNKIELFKKTNKKYLAVGSK